MINRICLCGKMVTLHSIVDVITNSSTVVYMWPSGNSDKYMKEMIQAFMTTMGVSGVPEDYFTIDFCLDPGKWRDIKEHFTENYEFEETWNKVMPGGLEPTGDEGKDWEAIKEQLMSLRGDVVWKIVPARPYDECNYPTYIILSVSPIGNPGMNIAKSLLNMVEADAEYNG